MAVISILGSLAGIVLSYFLIKSVATLAHLIAVGTGFAVAAGIIYHTLENDLLDVLFESEGFQVVSSIFIGSISGFFAYRVLESVFSLLGFAAAFLIGLTVMLSILFTPQLAAQFLKGIFQFFAELIGGD